MFGGGKVTYSRDTKPPSIPNHRDPNYFSSGSAQPSRPDAKGLELLSSASLLSEISSLVAPVRLSSAVSDSSQSSFRESLKRLISESSSDTTGTAPSKHATDTDDEKKPKSKPGRIYIDDMIREDDILCGRGGRSNNHAGNKRYRQVVNDMRIMYQNTETKTVKTDLSRAIVEHCCSYGARFLKIDNAAGKYFVLTKGEARKKTSQALRETKDLKWTSM